MLHRLCEGRVEGMQRGGGKQAFPNEATAFYIAGTRLHALGACTSACPVADSLRSGADRGVRVGLSPRRRHGLRKLKEVSQVHSEASVQLLDSHLQGRVGRSDAERDSL
jgi:hypothetical protein